LQLLVHEFNRYERKDEHMESALFVEWEGK